MCTSNDKDSKLVNNSYISQFLCSQLLLQCIAVKAGILLVNIINNILNNACVCLKTTKDGSYSVIQRNDSVGDSFTLSALEN